MFQQTETPVVAKFVAVPAKQNAIGNKNAKKIDVCSSKSKMFCCSKKMDLVPANQNAGGSKLQKLPFVPVKSKTPMVANFCAGSSKSKSDGSKNSKIGTNQKTLVVANFGAGPSISLP